MLHYKCGAIRAPPRHSPGNHSKKDAKSFLARMATDIRHLRELSDSLLPVARSPLRVKVHKSDNASPSLA